MPNQYVYDEPDNDDYKVFPPPGPGTVIESTGHGYTIVLMAATTGDKGGDGTLAMAAKQQPKTPVAAVKDGGVGAAAPAAVEADLMTRRNLKDSCTTSMSSTTPTTISPSRDNCGEEH
jgi:hypothetical protein